MRLSSIAEAVATLRANPLRSLLSTLGIIMGVASLVAVLAVGDGVESFAREQIARTTDLQSVAVEPQATRQVDGVRFPNPGYPTFTIADVDSVRSILPRDVAIDLLVTGSGQVESPKFDRVRAAVITGALTGPDSVSSGRSLSVDDARREAAVVVVSATLAGALGGDVVGDSLRLEGTTFAIVGVAAAFRGETGLSAVVPFTMAGKAMTPVAEPRVTPLIATGSSLEQVDTIRTVLRGWAARRVIESDRFVAVKSNQGRLAQAQQGVLIFKLLMGTITGISLLVGGIGIMNVLLAAVAERTREIGIRKATGAKRSDILLQFLAESAVITSAGALVGIGVGFVAAFGATALMRSRANVHIYAAFTVPTVLLSALIAVAIGIAFGMYPALRAARLDPIEAIRHE